MKGQRKDDVAHEYLKGFLASGRREGVLFIGRAQEKTPVFRTEKRCGADGSTYPWIVNSSNLNSARVPLGFAGFLTCADFRRVA